MGNRKKNIQRAIEFLTEEHSQDGCATRKVMTVSSIYETEPLYHIHQPLFLNCALCMETESTAQALLSMTKEIEKKMGRKNNTCLPSGTGRGIASMPEAGRPSATRFGPRLIDLDILFFDNLILRTEELIIPHPEIAERKFVLLPLIEIAPDLVHPVLKKTVKELLGNPSIDSQVVKKLL